MKSKDEFGACSYRGSAGLMCAIGCLIPDEMYEVAMEGRSVGKLRDAYPDIAKMFGLEQVTLLGYLQRLHDDTRPEDWAYELAELERMDFFNGFR